jgi:hypothetical protein
MIQDSEALDFVGEMAHELGINIAIGVNAYVEDADSFSEYIILIDPSSLSIEDESELEEYSVKRGFKVFESWNDWGRFLRISKLRPVFVSAFSP